MSFKDSKVVIVGCGNVGSTTAYTIINQGLAEEVVLIDVNRDKAYAEALDMAHSIYFMNRNINIHAGDYSDCADAHFVVMPAGRSRKPGQTRFAQLNDNVKLFKSFIPRIVASGFDGVFLVASNPVDIMTRVTYELSGFPAGRVLGSGTTLDTARLRYLVGDYFHADPRSVHGYVIGEHGDSEFVPYSQLYLSTKHVSEFFTDERFKDQFNEEDMNDIVEKVKNSGAEVIASKGATYYGIGMALVNITRAIFGDENRLMTVSSRLNGEYGLRDVYLGLPAFVNRNGVRMILPLNLTEEEQAKLKKSYDVLKESYDQLDI